ncbi:putative Glyoxalase/bleomycin resistance protein/dioxygenase [Modestobacter italicus]|uniref:Glyoxalase/bleomycin resistance protein/dioxygenase n=1 Tax=Modestobacter italicus (strain DSM 44449 / CECT 9708 / BC 501) TaxID=2732864 RepID=I4F020_MODI5|nr:VOC family protein [Modestobacter marinus]CCH88983.1 putative Glyoxalase/bleomycin resistance protein/dioxygenase [Modestobacter marinus]
MSASPPFASVTDVFCFVPDLAAATAWYTDRLGSPPVLVARQLARFDLGGSRLTVHSIDEFNGGGPAGCVACWDVEDVDALVAEWVRHGAVAHRGPKTIMTGERLCQLRDPFGNLLGVRQAPAPAAPLPSGGTDVAAG